MHLSRLLLLCSDSRKAREIVLGLGLCLGLLLKYVDPVYPRDLD